MRLGISLPFARPDGSAPSAPEIAARARLIERVGFDGIWFGETIGRTTSARPDVLAWLLVAALATERIEVGTAILQLPLRHPVELAQRFMTMHLLTGGRFVAGLGAGSTRADYDAVGVDFDRRFRLFASGLKTVRRLCDGEQVGDANLYPWPNAVGGPPILIGAWESGIWVQRAARDYNGWQGSGRTSFRALKEGIARFRDAGGKRAMVVTVSIDLTAPNTTLDEDEMFSLKCGPEEAAERLQRLDELGFDDVALVRMGHTTADLHEDELLAIRALLTVEQPSLAR
jgi:alkanesulfonate monooxygenase SsuD/methylene tetrahydromethanopterin reductase-like flavin-dependent oxidoreductase (luciferase family)